jgi:Tol biopolymer transport system component
VLFASDRDGDFDLFMSNLDGSDPVPVTNNTAFDGDPTFSPDGTQAVFVSSRDGNNDLFLLDIEDCNPADVSTCEPQRLTATAENESFPDFSPDGETVVFSRNTADPSSLVSDLDLFVLDLDSGDTAQLTSQPGDDAHPQFSPDGSAVAFDGQFGGARHIAIVGLDGSEPVPVTIGRSIGSTGPQWVDADTLIYVRPAGEAGELVELDFQTRDPERVLFDEPELELAAISTDGDKIVFRSDDDLFVADRDGNDAERITDDQGFNNEADLFEPN